MLNKILSETILNMHIDSEKYFFDSLKFSSNTFSESGGYTGYSCYVYTDSISANTFKNIFDSTGPRVRPGSRCSYLLSTQGVVQFLLPLIVLVPPMPFIARTWFISSSAKDVQRSRLKYILKFPLTLCRPVISKDVKAALPSIPKPPPTDVMFSRPDRLVRASFSQMERLPLIVLISSRPDRFFSNAFLVILILPANVKFCIPCKLSRSGLSRMYTEPDMEKPEGISNRFEIPLQRIIRSPLTAEYLFISLMSELSLMM